MSLFCSKCGTKNKSGNKICSSCNNLLEALRGLLPEGVILEKRYKILKLIKAGGMGAVYKAEDLKLKNICAVKELLTPYGEEEKRKQSEEWFNREAKILAKLDHANLPKIIDYFVAYNRYYLVMTLIEGEDMETIIERDFPGGMEEEKVIAIAVQVLDVLDYLHNHSPPIIYRDIKPANIMIHKDGRAILIDFGIARAINPDSDTQKTAIGTLGYISEEQCDGKAEPRSDIYSLGATMHHLLTGKIPVSLRLGSVSNFRKISPELEKIVMKSLEEKAQNRFSSAEEMKKALEELKTDNTSSEYKKILSKKNNLSNYSIWYKRLKLLLSIALLYLIILGMVKGGNYLYHKIKGSPWKTQKSGTSKDINSISFIDSNNGWAVGAGGLILYTDNGGASWETQNSPISESGWLCDVKFIDLKNGWAVGKNITDDGGYGIILHTVDGGITWEKQKGESPAELREVNFIDINKGWVIGYGGTILHTDNGGKTWKAQESGVSGELEGVQFLDQKTGWIVGTEKKGGNKWFSIILHTDNGGTTWNIQEREIKGSINDVNFINYKVGWAVGVEIIRDKINGMILCTTDGGKTWKQEDPGFPTLYLNKICFVNNKKGWITGISSKGKGMILHTSNGGKNWEEQSYSSLPLLNKFDFIDESCGWAAGPEGMILKFTAREDE